MTRILLIRHGMTSTAGKRLTGRASGVHLNEEGRMQAQHLATTIVRESPSAVYASPLERTMETAMPIALALGLDTIQCEDLIEIDFGHWTNREIEELRDDQDFVRFNMERSRARIPGGEALDAVQQRMRRAMLTFATQHPNQTVVAVSHAEPIRIALLEGRGMTLDDWRDIDIAPASVTIFHVNDEHVVTEISSLTSASV